MFSRREFIKSASLGLGYLACPINLFANPNKECYSPTFGKFNNIKWSVCISKQYQFDGVLYPIETTMALVFETGEIKYIAFNLEKYKILRLKKNSFEDSAEQITNIISDHIVKNYANNIDNLRLLTNYMENYSTGQELKVDNDTWKLSELTFGTLTEISRRKNIGFEERFLKENK